MNKQIGRARRAARTKAVIRTSKKLRLVVFRSANHIYSQIVEPTDKGDRVLVASSTRDKEIRGQLTGTKMQQAAEVGRLLAKRALQKNINSIAFDRSGYAYHGRVESLAQAARDEGLTF